MTDTPTPASSLAAAELRAAQARGALQTTLGMLQVRLDPRMRVDRAKRDARIVGETAIAAIRDNPAFARNLAAGTLLIFGVVVGRRRIARLFGRNSSDGPASTAGLKPVTRTRQ